MLPAATRLGVFPVDCGISFGRAGETGEDRGAACGLPATGSPRFCEPGCFARTTGSGCSSDGGVVGGAAAGLLCAVGTGKDAAAAGLGADWIWSFAVAVAVAVANGNGIAIGVSLMPGVGCVFSSLMRGTAVWGRAFCDGSPAVLSVCVLPGGWPAGGGTFIGCLGRSGIDLVFGAEPVSV